MSLKPKHVTIVLAALTTLLSFALVGSGFLANQLLMQKSQALGKLKAQSQVASDLQITLNKDKADIVRYKDLNEIAKSVVPKDKNQAQTVGEIIKMAQASGINKISNPISARLIFSLMKKN